MSVLVLVAVVGVFSFFLRAGFRVFMSGTDLHYKSGETVSPVDTSVSPVDTNCICGVPQGTIMGPINFSTYCSSYVAVLCKVDIELSP